MTADKRYQNIRKNIKPNTGFRGGFNQTYELRADIERRPAGEYTRKLAVSPPPRPGQDDGGAFGNFGGGPFGGPGE